MPPNKFVIPGPPLGRSCADHLPTPDLPAYRPSGDASGSRISGCRVFFFFLFLHIYIIWSPSYVAAVLTDDKDKAGFGPLRASAALCLQGNECRPNDVKKECPNVQISCPFRSPDPPSRSFALVSLATLASSCSSLARNLQLKHHLRSYSHNAYVVFTYTITQQTPAAHAISLSTSPDLITLP